MANSRVEAMFEALRSRVTASSPLPAAEGAEADALTRALHEIDVYQAELEIQNQDLLHTQLALSVARDRYHALFDEALVPFLLVTSTGVVQEANRAALTVLDRSRDRLIGKPLVVCLGEREPDRFFRHLAAVAESKVPQTVELQMSPGAAAPRTVVFKSTPFAGANDGTLLCQLTDVTEQRQAEEAKLNLERRLRESEKLEAVGRVAANIAHDVNNVLVSVISLGEFVRDQVPEHESLRADLEGMLDAAWRGARMMRGLLGLSRTSARPFAPVDLAELTLRVAGMLRRRKVGVEVRCVVDGGPVMVLADEDELLQALLNLGANGLDAMDSGLLEFSCSGSKDLARVVVRDTGSGMSPETLARAFEPLFTTKSEAGGSGLGLTLVQRTISGLHGTVELSSTLGKGTTVIVELPTLPLAKPASSSPSTVGGNLSLKVLLVDDDAQVRRSARRQLEKLGARVADYPDGPTAFEALKSGLRFDAAVVDINMPGWTGPELVGRIFRDFGALPVVFVTGATGDLLSESMLALRHVRLLRKPWSLAELADTIRTVVAARP